MYNITYIPQRTSLNHPLVRERCRRKRAERHETEFMTIATVMSGLLFVVMGVLVAVTGWL